MKALVALVIVPAVAAGLSTGPSSPATSSTTRQTATTKESRMEMITKEQAIQIAKQAVAGHLTTGNGPIIVELKDNEYVVTFSHPVPPNTATSGFDAQVFINANTGNVRVIMIGV